MQLNWLASESRGSPVFASQQACFYSKWFPNWSSSPALRVPTTLDQAGRKHLSNVSLRKRLSYLKELALLMFFGEWDHQTLVTYLCFIAGVCPASWLGDLTGLQRQESEDFGAFQRWLCFVWSWKWVQSGPRGSTGKSWPGNSIHGACARNIDRVELGPSNISHSHLEARMEIAYQSLCRVIAAIIAKHWLCKILMIPVLWMNLFGL